MSEGEHCEKKVNMEQPESPLPSPNNPIPVSPAPTVETIPMSNMDAAQEAPRTTKKPSNNNSRSNNRTVKKGDYASVMGHLEESTYQLSSYFKNPSTVKKLKRVITFTPVKEDYRWENLQDIEQRRRRLLTRVEEPIWKVLLSWDGTLLKILSTDLLLWITLLIYIGMRFIIRYTHTPDFLDSLNSNSITVLGGMMAFFMTMYVNQTNTRYFSLYNASMRCKGRIFDAATLAATALPYAKATRLIRYMNAAHSAAYVGLSEVYPSGNYFNHANKTMGLLTNEERQRLDVIDLDKGGSCHREIIVWCMNEVQQLQLDDPELSNHLRELVLALRVAIGELYNAQDLPIPFAYLNFICFITAIYLPIFAITAAISAGTGEDDIHWTAGFLRGLVVLLQTLFVLGLRCLGQNMSDPYGDHLIDFSVMFFVHFTWLHSNRILHSHFPEEASTAVEQRLTVKRKEALGLAWEPSKTTYLAENPDFDLTEAGEDVFFDAVTDVEGNRDKHVIANPNTGSAVYLA